MLKALELFGFKSFADRTRLEFPSGICVVVGPNGSGKSNVVDAVKWVLGSQSAKSLRGKEMVDVIFNGCASRSAAGTGEVTLTLDNSQARLAIDAKEVHVTRRVYRSGEGEYLLNRQPCRLRDIRELLASTGITTEAYCIIEQGKVDALLQSSPRERRVIFEEAAGISQFKIKKAAAARRMERVEQNLLRLSDIVEEVENRLRSVRQQAGKARRYREITHRLQQLRTAVALFDWQASNNALASRENQLHELKLRTTDYASRLEQADAISLELETRLEASSQKLRELDALAANTREEIAARQATLDTQIARQSELETEVARIREQLAATGNQHDSVDELIREATDRLAAAESEYQAAKTAHDEQVQIVQQLQTEMDAARSMQRPLVDKVDSFIRAAAHIDEQLSALEPQAAAAHTRLEINQARLAELQQSLQELTIEMRQCEAAETAISVDVDRRRASLSDAERRLDDFRREFARADLYHRRTEAQLTRVRERIAVLTELEDRLEGLGSGVQQVLQLAAQMPGGFATHIHGVVADLFHVDVDTASLIEVALGERTQFIVLSSGPSFLEWLQSNRVRVADRVGFLALDSRASLTALDNVDLLQESGVMGRADQFVETSAEYQPLARRLLGRTWLVDHLATARRLSQTTGRGLEFVTSDGELLASDGTLIVGPRHAASGVLSRRSELRSCQEQARDLESKLSEQAAILARLEHERNYQEKQVGATVAAFSEYAEKLAEASRQTASRAARLDQLSKEYRQLEEDCRTISEQIAATQNRIAELSRNKSTGHDEAENLKRQIAFANEHLASLEEKHAAAHKKVSELQIAVVRREQQVELLRSQLAQTERSHQERNQLLADARVQHQLREKQLAELSAAIPAHQQTIAGLLELKRQQAEQFVAHSATDEAIRRERAAHSEQLRLLRDQITALQTQQHNLEVAITRLRHERETLAGRMLDDYGIDLETLVNQNSQNPAIDNSVARPLDLSSPAGRDAVEREITTLREQINNIGAINLEALDELEQIEARFEKLSAQYRDLVDAKDSLLRITQRISVDSRQLFLTTLDTIRGHFQELFRRLFGGGEADIIVDESEDILECGIEILAKPPGKEACSISLLSGGEKTLTCVALLLAVFRSKPSPFCILDEVDAALDEANIGRFVAVLRDFLSFTQFIVITHSKKTMSGADTIYGITMEESGVSKRVSVRFEDVGEDGHISQAALRHAA